MGMRGPTTEQIRAWIAEIPDHPLTVQPSYKEAEKLVRWMGETGRYGAWWLVRDPVCSTIHERCADCGKVIVSRHNYMVPDDARAETRYEMRYWRFGVRYSKPGTICLGCFNKRRTEYKALREWEDTRLALVNAKYNIAKVKKGAIT